MSIDSTEVYSLSQKSEFVSVPFGSGSPAKACGQFRSYGHTVGEMVHGETVRYRCKRAECPECWDKPFGYVWQAVERMRKGLNKGLDPKSPFGDNPTHLIVTPQCELALFFDSAYRRDLLKRVREHYGRLMGTPGAWVIHYGCASAAVKGYDTRGIDAGRTGARYGDLCPQAPHIHVFVPSMLDIKPQKPDLIDDAIEVRQIDHHRIPEIEAVVRGLHQVVPGATISGMKRKSLPVIGWFGRGKVTKFEREIAEEVKREEAARFCHTCGKQVGKAEWSRVVPRSFRPEKEGPWTIPLSDAEFISTDWRETK
jgi:hypothetical protein